MKKLKSSLLIITGLQGVLWTRTRKEEAHCSSSNSQQMSHLLYFHVLIQQIQHRLICMRRKGSKVQQSVDSCKPAASTTNYAH